MEILLDKRLSAAGVDVRAFFFPLGNKITGLSLRHKYLFAVVSGCICTGVLTDSSLCVFVSYFLCLSPCAQWQKERCLQDKSVEVSAILVVSQPGEASAVVDVYSSSSSSSSA